MSPSLGKGYTSNSDQTSKSRVKPKKEKEKEKVDQEGTGSIESGRPFPFHSSAQIGNRNQAGSITNQVGGGRQRGHQPARHPISTSLREQIFKRDHYQCCNCQASPLTNTRVRLEVDHIVPVSRGCTNDPHNLQTLCHECNQLKRASLI